ncbi:hypothetical protein Hdeb2414_s0009g00301091 [Helianthus debilis subsp. tardiflorus]
MAINTFIHLLTVTLLFTLYVSPSLSSDPAGNSPAPAPQLGSDDPVSPPVPSAVSPPSPPPASDLTPSPSQSQSPAPASDKSAAPAPAPETADSGDLASSLKNEEENKSSSGGMSGGEKAGIAIGVIAAVCVVGFGGVLYKKRQQNIRRAEFSSAARREFL